MSLLTLYHGSQKIISVPLLGEEESFKDFGSGFYLTQSKEAASQWACSLSNDGFVNKYEIETENLNILDLYSDEYHILNWLALVMSSRKYRVSEAGFERNLEYLKENFLVDTTGYDIIKGMRADETYFFFAKAFLKGRISLRQFKILMNLGPLGEQLVIKSPDAGRRLVFSSFEMADATYVYPRKKTRNDGAQANYVAEVALGDEGGLFMGDILKKEIKNDAECLR